MSSEINQLIAALGEGDKTARYQSFLALQAASNEQVDWAYDLWELLVRDLQEGDNHQRAVAAQLLSNLAKSDPEERIFSVFPRLLEATKDKQFVTARHTLQSLWKVGLAGPRQKKLLLAGLEERYNGCTEEKNSTLIRFDIIQSLRKLYDQLPDPALRETALEWIEREEDLKYRKKYAGVWKKTQE